MADGQVAIRFSVKDAEAVRHALAQLGKDGEAALRRFDAPAAPVHKNLSGISAVIDELKNRALGFVPAAGLAGTALTGMGAVGVVAAVGIGVMIAALNKAGEMAHELAQKAKELRELSVSTGLTTIQLQALGSAAGKVGIDSEKLGTGVEKLTIELEQIRRGGGSARDALLRINPTLLDQLSLTKNTADALTVLGKAYEKLDVDRANALSRALFGRGGIAMSRLLPGLDVSKLEEDFKAAGKGLDDNLINKLAQLEVDIARSSKAFNRNLASIFSEDILAKQLKYYQQWEMISKVAKEFGISAGLRALLESNIGNSAIGSLPVVGGLLAGSRAIAAATSRALPQPSAPSASGNIDELLARRQEAVEKLEYSFLQLQKKAEEGDPVAIKRWQERADQAAESLEKVDKELDAVKGKAAALPAVKDVALLPKPTGELSTGQQLANQRDIMQVLGEAAKPTEQLKVKTLELNNATENNSRVTDAAKRALASFNLSQKEAELAIRERLGIASQEEILITRLARLDDQYGKGFVKNAQERALAEGIVRKETRATAEAMAVRASATPALTQLSFDSANLAKTLDTELASAARGATQDLLAMAKGTVTLGQGLSNLTMRFVDAIAQAVIMKTVVGPLSTMLSGGLSGLFPASAAPAAVPSAQGNVFHAGNVVPFQRGGVLNRPAVFPMANGGIGLAAEAGPEAIVPLRRHNGRLGIDASGMGGGSVKIEHQIHNYAPGVQVEQRTSSDGMRMETIITEVGKGLAAEASRNHGALRNTFQQKPRLIG